MIRFVDNFLDRITMYRLVLYYLIVLDALAVVFGLFGVLHYNPGDLIFSAVVILASCWAANKVFAKAFRAQANVESYLITALILALIITPVAPADKAGIAFLMFASAWAMASKYLFAIGKKHVFNPAAFGVALAALTIGRVATWWVAGNVYLLPFVFIGGLLIVRKIRRFDLVIAFMVAAFATIIATTPGGEQSLAIRQTLLHSSLFFLAFVMLTEPLTMPPDRKRRIFYGVLVGILFAPNVHIGSFYFTPELALLVGNIFVYAVSPKGRFMLTLIGKNKIGNDTYEFVFAPDRPLSFEAGQYLEWTLSHRKPDDRGNRRYFTIASAPSEPDVRMGVKFYDPKSSFKRELMRMDIDDTISASHLAGDFTLPKDKKKKLTFIAGGIGVTPFRAMVQHMVDEDDPRPVTFFYANKKLDDIAYRDVFDAASRKIGMKMIYTVDGEQVNDPGVYGGKLTADLIAKEVPDYKERMFYISGPHGMVEAFKRALREMGVPRWHVKVDYFPGFA